MHTHDLKSRLKTLLLAEHNPTLQALLLEHCKRDIVFWINHFCWTFDPRETQPHRPFLLYPFQETFVRQLQRDILEGRDVLVEKSRDMGATWLVLLVFQHNWLFREGFHGLAGSRKADLVDRKGDLATLFEKLRYNLAWLPAWMTPDGYSPSKHDHIMKLINPTNGNTLTGESSNGNFARGGRYTAILMDEFPFWANDDTAYASAGQSSPCRIVLGTPYGKHNAFAKLRFGGHIGVRTLHWTQHPNKDAEWYAIQCKRMSEDEIARELDINYNLSVRHRVFAQFGNTHKGNFKAIDGRKILRSWDFGYHCPACLFIQLDAQDRVHVLGEVVGKQTLLKDFAQQVLNYSDTHFPGACFEDICDPAGSQKSDKADQTCIDILNSLGIYPFYERSQIIPGLELMRHLMADQVDNAPRVRVDRSCLTLIDALEGGYRYGSTDQEHPLEEHPYEDVVDCLRYAIVHKCRIPGKPIRRPTRPYKPRNRYTGY